MAGNQLAFWNTQTAHNALKHAENSTYTLKTDTCLISVNPFLASFTSCKNKFRYLIFVNSYNLALIKYKLYFRPLWKSAYSVITDPWFSLKKPKKAYFWHHLIVWIMVEIFLYKWVRKKHIHPQYWGDNCIVEETVC